MSVARKWVFPILRIVIFAAIAAALVKIAFFADPQVEAGPEFPTGQIVEPQVAVTIGTILNNVEVQGTVAADAARAVPATLAGEVNDIAVPVGTTVAANDRLLTIRAEVPGVVSPDGTVAAPTYKYVAVRSPIAGVVSNLAVILGQVVSVGDAVGQVAPPSFNVSGALKPDQLYRLLNQPTEATVTVTGGPAPFTCTGLTLTTSLAGAQPPAEGTAEGAGSGTTASCAVPAEVKVFTGLQATMSIPGGVAENVLVLPVTAVEGTAQSGNAYFVLEDGSTEVRPIALGLTDGTHVQVVSGLAEGDMVLQFVPGAPENSNVPEGCTADGDGNVVSCGG